MRHLFSVTTFFVLLVTYANAQQKTTTKGTVATLTKKFVRKKECGVQLTSNRIVGGNETAIDEFPFLALLYYKSANGKLRYKCGGSLIKDRTILTAAHCVEGKLGKTLEFVRLGEWNTKTEQDCVSIGFGEEDCGKLKLLMSTEMFPNVYLRFLHYSFPADDPIDFKVKGKFDIASSYKIFNS